MWPTEGLAVAGRAAAPGVAKLTPTSPTRRLGSAGAGLGDRVALGTQMELIAMPAGGQLSLRLM